MLDLGQQASREEQGQEQDPATTAAPGTGALEGPAPAKGNRRCPDGTAGQDRAMGLADGIDTLLQHRGRCPWERLGRHSSQETKACMTSASQFLIKLESWKA